MADWIDIDKKLEKEHQKKIIGLGVINNPEHYHGKTLELQDVFKDFFGTKTFIANCCMNIIYQVLECRTLGGSSECFFVKFGQFFDIL